jgi:hypothetical protein
VPGYAFNTPAKQDGFNLDVVKVAIERPLDESPWAAGYKVEMLYGPDANAFGTSPVGGLAATDFALKQAYVSLRMPVGNGIDWKLGVFDTVVGYESFDAGSNPNYTRSYGYSLEPTTHTGLLGTYRFSDLVSASAGIANTTGPIIGGANLGGSIFPTGAGRAHPYRAESYKTYLGSIALTAPDSWGFLSGSTLYGGIVHGFGGGNLVVGRQINLYAGATIATPVTGLRLGLAYDYFGVPSQTILGTPINSFWANAVAAYASWQATDKLGVHVRGEYMWTDNASATAAPLGATKVFALTGTLQYDLWKNVISRLEVRWDHAADGTRPYGGALIGSGPGGPNGSISGGSTDRNEVIVAANVIYKF